MSTPTLPRTRHARSGLYTPGFRMQLNGTALDPTDTGAFAWCRLTSPDGATQDTKSSQNGGETTIEDAAAGDIRFIWPASEVASTLVEGVWTGIVVYENPTATPAKKYVVAEFEVEMYNPEGGAA